MSHPARRTVPVASLLACALALVLLASGCRFLHPSGVQTVSPDGLAALVAAPDGPLVLDARSPEEYASGHVPGAVNVPFRDVPAHLVELEPYKARGVVTYCEHGPRSALAQRALADAGFTKLWQLEGDMSRWRSEGRPMEKAK